MSKPAAESTHATLALPVVSTRIPCAHCGSPTTSTSSPAFCCSGCKNAYELIDGWGLDEFYGLREPSDGPTSQTTDDEVLSLFDDDGFLGDSAPVRLDDGSLRVNLTILGLHCAACVWLIENMAGRIPGWKTTRVRMVDHSIEIVFDPAKIRLSQIAGVLQKVGYALAPRSDDQDDGYRRENRQLLIRIALAGFCAANAMWIAIALYAGDATGLEPVYRTFLRWTGTGLGLVAVWFPGRTFLVGALAALRTRTPHMDLPVALGLTAGSVAGVASLLLGQGEVYFDSLAILVFLLLIGRWVQLRQQHRAARAVDLLLKVTPRHARKVNDDDDVTLIPAMHLQPGDRVRVMAGESVAADGVVLTGQSLLDRSLLTGESRPVVVEPGDTIDAGVVNLSSQLDLRVEAVGQESRIGRVMRSVEEASNNKAPIVQLADRMGGVFVCVVSMLALVTFALWAPASWIDATSHATALLIVACPCALALATPLALAVAIGRSAKQKVFVSDGATLGALSKPGVIWFDKTGTLTQGRPTATVRTGEQSILAIAAAIEAQIHHPIAEAICRAADQQDIAAVGAAESVTLQLGGVSGQVNGQTIQIGNESFLQTSGVEIPAPIGAVAAEVLGEGSTAILVAIDAVATGVIAIADSIKPDAFDTINRLQKTGWKVGILSGDHPKMVGQVAQRLGLETDNCFGELSPEEKLQIVSSDTRLLAGKSGTKVMVGDGANDAAALAAADVGIAVRGGAEVSLRAAPVFVASGRLATITDLLAAAKRTNQLIYTAMATSLAYNLIAVGLAMTGRISPLVAAVLMPISSVTVLSLCLAWPIYSDGESLDDGKLPSPLPPKETP